MNIDKEELKYYIFVGGLCPYVSENWIKMELSKLGPVESIQLKMRTKPPILNLGYGILTITNREFFQELLRRKFLFTSQCKIEFKEYMDSKQAKKVNMINYLKFQLILVGIEEGITEQILTRAISSKCQQCSIQNIIFKRNHNYGNLTGEAKIKLNREKDLI